MADHKEESKTPVKAPISSVYVDSPAVDRNSAEYKALGEKFDKQFGEKMDPKYLEEVSKKLDTKFKVLAQFTKEAESSNCDMLLFKTKLEREMADLQNELREAWNAVQILMAERVKLRDLFIQYQMKFEKFRAQVKMMADQINERNSIIERQNAIMGEQKKEIIRLREELELLRKQLNEKLAEIAQLNKEMAELKKENERLKLLVDQLRATNAKLTTEIERLRALLAQREQELSAALQQLAQLKAANKELSSILERLRADYDKLRKDYDRLKMDYEKLLAEVNRLRKENDELNAQLLKLKGMYNELVAKYAELQKLNKELQIENDKLKEMFEQASRRARELEDEVNRLKRELQFMKENYETELARLRDENARLRDENRDLKEQNKNLRDNKELLEREIERYKIEIENLKRQLEALLEEKRLENERRRNRKGDKQKYLDLIKKSLLNKAAPEALPQVLLDAEALNAERATRRAQPLQKPKIKAFVEFEKQRTAYYTHYIAHPCPYCMPTHYGCPIHGGHHAVPGKLTEQELNTARVMLQSDNPDEQAKGLRTLFFHAQADDRAKQFIEEKYPGMDVEGIIKGQDFIEFAMQLTHLLSGYQKSRDSYMASVHGSGMGSGMGSAMMASSSSHTMHVHESPGHKL